MPKRERSGAVIKAGARGGADEREMAKLKRVNARTGALADDEIDAKVLHGGIEDFLDSWLEAVNFIEKEDFLAFERSKDSGEVAFAFEQRTGAGFDRNVEFIGDDLGESGFAEARRAVEQNVIESFAAAARGFNSDRDVFLDALLADIFIQTLWADAGLYARVFIVGSTGDDSVLCSSVWHPFCACVSHRLRFALV